LTKGENTNLLNGASNNVTWKLVGVIEMFPHALKDDSSKQHHVIESSPTGIPSAAKNAQQ